MIVAINQLCCAVDNTVCLNTTRSIANINKQKSFSTRNSLVVKNAAWFQEYLMSTVILLTATVILLVTDVTLDIEKRPVDNKSDTFDQRTISYQ